GDDDLAAADDLDPVLLAEVDHQVLAFDAELRLEGARLVVDAGVDDAAVVAGLVRAELRLLLEDDQPRAPGARGQRSRSGEADDASAHDGEVEAFIHGWGLLNRRCGATASVL